MAYLSDELNLLNKYSSHPDPNNPLLLRTLQLINLKPNGSTKKIFLLLMDS